VSKNPELTIPVLLGPTASGKTNIGIELAKKIDAEIISVDSRKVYKHLPIGTAMPRGRWVEGAYYVHNIAHHLMGTLSPDDFYTAGDFAKEATELITQIIARKRKPLLVGGTGFYFKALQQGLPSLPARDSSLRDEIEDRMIQQGLPVLYEELTRLDPEAAKAISSQDRHKIIRALEVFHLTGEPFSTWKQKPKRPSPFHFVVMGLQFDKEVLDNRIEARSQKMVEHGMIQETERVLLKGYPKTCPALSSFGYREAVNVIEGTLPEKEFLPRLIKGTKAYARRQRTWFRTQIQPQWFPCDEKEKKEAIAMKMYDILKFS